MSEFLSPRVNLRTDRWGGDLKSRARLLFEVLRTIRKSVGPDCRRPPIELGGLPERWLLT
ncbi:hypothetical protein [Rhizobium nepotum]|uniref:oxidoreductase n=1 Tax=Rhizobium nepotum TaxID=1035271 RepID=UPI003CE9DF2A